MARVHAPSWIGPGLAILFMVPLLVYGVYSIGDRWYQNYLLNQQEEAIRAEVVRLREENLRLQRELNRVKSDAGIEQVAREQLGLVKPGDTAIQITGPTGPAAAAPAAQRPPQTPPPHSPPERPIWLRVLDGLFGR
jgi:cell division protein FtsL